MAETVAPTRWLTFYSFFIAVMGLLAIVRVGSTSPGGMLLVDFGSGLLLLGDKENDLTYALGWGLARSEHLSRRLLAEVFPAKTEIGELRAVPARRKKRRKP